MMRLIKLFIALLLIHASAVAQPKINPLQQRDIDYGCGCSFHIPPARGAKGQQILQWELDAPAKMRVDGELHQLKVTEIRPRALDSRPERIGDKTIFNLTAPALSVRAVCTAVEVCKPSDESCESVSYRAVLSVRAKSGTAKINAWAVCGC
ncbi:MAG TPA: hypothetical protein PK708_12745 [Candidatus Competibacter sp.]|nr:hypothetical protein [Candidatus Competibacter sp.]